MPETKFILNGLGEYSSYGKKFGFNINGVVLQGFNTI